MSRLVALDMSVGDLGVGAQAELEGDVVHLMQWNCVGGEDGVGEIEISEERAQWTFGG